MKTLFRAKLLPLAITALLAASPVLAQDTSSAISGRVLDASGQPVAGATVQIVHEPSGTTKVVTTDADGRYSAQGLRVGGPFDVTVSKAGLAQADKSNVYLQLGQVSAINLQMGSGAVQAKNLKNVTVTASALAQTFSADNKGLSTNVSGRELETTPQGNRSIDDIARLDPRVNVTDQGDGSISMAGMPNRYNNISVDGMSQGDPFGLNANGLPYQGSPISVDTIGEYNISTANFDVTSDTVGADINAVTKSGTNKFHGSVYYVYRNANSMVGNAGWLSSSNPGYDYTGYKKDWTGGFTVGGPIIKDKLFFFLSAEHEKTTGIGADSSNGLDTSLTGASTSNKISPSDLQQVIDTAKALGLQPGSFGAGGSVLDDKRYLAKIDWNISDNHRASLTYQYTKEAQPIVQGNSSNQIGLSSYWYTKNSLTKNTALQLYDDWSQNFSTETKISYQSFQQLAGNAISQPQVKVYMDTAGRGPSVNLGEDQYRHENAIRTKKWSAFFAGTYYLGDHTIKGGIEYQRDQIYNLFGRTEFGNYTFYGLSNFAAANYNSYYLYQPAPGYTINDVAAKWVYSQYSPFLQDTWQVNNNLSIAYGLRMDIPQSDHAPLYNAAFTQAFGYRNNSSLGSKNRVVEPRFSFNYAFDTQRMTQLRGGVGLFQTFPPTVWMTNPYQNNGLTVASYSSFNPANAAFSPDAYHQNIPNSPGSVSGDVDTISPNFKLPTVWKATLALDRELPWWGMIGSVELQHIKVDHGIYYQAINIGAPTGVLPDGRFQYWATPGERPKSSDAAANRNKAFDKASTLLTNTSKGKSDSLTFSVSKPFSESWFGDVSFTMSHATEVNPGNSSQASSGYAYVVRQNVNEQVAATADRNIPRTLKASLTWQHAFFGDYKTAVSAFYNGHSGLPYSWIFSGDVNGDGITYEDPVYIPTLNDPKVSYGTTPAQVVQQFQDYITGNSYLNNHRGQIAARNGAHYGWVNQLDMSFSQEVPGIFKGNKGVVRLDVYNFLNLLDNKWGQTVNTQFNTRTLAGYNGVNAQGQYVYSLPTDSAGNYQPQQLIRYDAGSNPTRVVSRWSAMLTLRYTF
ncbi:MAG: carboxypeptidase regulatory-like domain-containing protein [Pseudomonadota bacterium]|nr:carboxypeptidase regulatory-like domain-containing protein [Pseudomonadota bacterium]